MSVEDDECLTVSVPEAGKAFGLGRNASYNAANRGEIPVLQFGKLKRVSKAWVRNILRAGGDAT